MKNLNPMLLCDCYKIGYRKQYPNVKNITLRVTHGIYSKGKEVILEHIDNIIDAGTYDGVKEVNKVVEYPKTGVEVVIELQKNHKKWNEEFKKEQKQKKRKNKDLKR